MKLNDLNVINFPDGHKHLKDYSKDHILEASVKSFDDLFLIAQAKEIMPNLNTLYIKYLLGARCDRKFSDKEAIDLEIIARFINSLNFKEVEILKPHSIKSLQLINNSSEHSYTSQLLQRCIIDQQLKAYSIISPDKGASRWITQELGSEGVIQCDKERNTNTGEVISITFTDIPKEDCIIVDDLCDGGATFLNLAQELRNREVKRVYLVITHGIFSKGFRVFDGLIDRIYCTDSFNKFEDKLLTQIEV